ncbi:hypothetical protein COLO4_30543 [Corchorus olitorius]|uniref:non-specific serine/threonine protein kinase n=1 Tax=Corchorus olitorius TaxID=93759 RepID=A0A1R3H803_9ROSI|nr:hypothetical protein COLO4_30543 [Corchorus olitorius]
MKQPAIHLRSFPEGEKNCYTLNLRKGDRYLIRASFLYGNYDEKNKLPEFDLYLGSTFWVSAVLNSSIDLSWEMIHVLESNYLQFCLMNTGKGTPFISAFELRLLKNTTYAAGSMATLQRYDVCSTSKAPFRFNEDIYDRGWWPYQTTDWKQITTSSTIEFGKNDYQPPLLAMKTACVPANASQPLYFLINSTNPIDQYYLYMHFAEIETLKANQSREFNISINGQLFYGPYSPKYLISDSIYSTVALGGGLITIERTKNSSLPPIVNAIEIYVVKEFLELQTADTEVDAIITIRSMYGLKRNWQGDPCTPPGFVWEGVKCSYNNGSSPRIISLDLSSIGLTGKIPPHLANLTHLQNLDLSNNSLTGPIPKFLSELQFLTILNLKDNRLNGSIPTELVDRSSNGLTLSVEGNPNLCAKDTCAKKKKNNRTIVAMVASVATFAVLISAIAILWVCKRRRTLDGKMDVKSRNTFQSEESKTRQFKYSEILRMTNNFERALGRGGFGTVFHGYLGDTQVAVKMLSESSAQGYIQFKAEVQLLLRVHHRSLIPLIGYCDDGTYLGLIYEYMAKGDLAEHLSANDSDILSWEGRLRIALEAAQGLEYLHNGCKPPIIHRDVKTANILITENMQAKLADFGLSKSFQTEGQTHVSTVVAGTPGYLDPEYSTSYRLTEKSDVYSFGVVLLEIITSRPVIERRNGDEVIHIKQWVSFMLSNGDIKSIVDQKLRGDFDTNSVWKAVELAMACVSLASTKRPTMNYVATELAECLSFEIDRKRRGHENVSQELTGMVSINFGSEVSPLAR